jgi:hypothetical protein
MIRPVGAPLELLDDGQSLLRAHRRGHSDIFPHRLIGEIVMKGVAHRPNPSPPSTEKSSTARVADMINPSLDLELRPSGIFSLLSVVRAFDPATFLTQINWAAPTRR